MHVFDCNASYGILDVPRHGATSSVGRRMPWLARRVRKAPVGCSMLLR